MLSDKIWLTRKTRVYTEQRLIQRNTFTSLLTIWYSFCLVFFSVWNLQYPNNNLNLFIVISSILVLVMSTVVASQKYTERSLAIRDCYLKLDELYLKTKRGEKKEKQKLLNECQNEYSEILKHVENHTDFDYLCLRFSLRNNENTTLPRFTLQDGVIYVLYQLIAVVIYAVLFLGLPICFCFIWGIF
jgi:hypothetical protein